MIIGVGIATTTAIGIGIATADFMTATITAAGTVITTTIAGASNFSAVRKSYR